MLERELAQFPQQEDADSDLDEEHEDEDEEDAANELKYVFRSGRLDVDPKAFPEVIVPFGLSCIMDVVHSLLHPRTHRDSGHRCLGVRWWQYRWLGACCGGAAHQHHCSGGSERWGREAAHTTTSSTARRGSHVKHAAEACHLQSCVLLLVAAKIVARRQPRGGKLGSVSTPR